MRLVNKDQRLTFRVQKRLKMELERIAAREGRSVAQICETFLTLGIQEYTRRPATVQELISRQRIVSDKPKLQNEANK